MVERSESASERIAHAHNRARQQKRRVENMPARVIRNTSSSRNMSDKAVFERKGQLESSFQWVYVLIAGGSFLLLFFLLFRSCSSAGASKQDAAAITAAAYSISSIGWQSDMQKNIIVPEIVVMCPAGGVVLRGAASTTTGSGIDKPLDRVPIFFPAKIGGTLTILMRNISIDMGSSGTISYGTVGYAIDPKTYYVFLRPERESSAEFIQAKKFYESINGSNVRFVKREDLGAELDKLPTSAHAITIILFDDTDTDTIDAFVATLRPKISMIRIRSGVVGFYKLNQTTNTLITDGTTSYIDGRFALGAIITGDRKLYLCTKGVILERAKKITAVYGDRAEQIASSPSSTLNPNCKELYKKIPNGINMTLYALNRQAQEPDPDGYLTEITHPTTMQYLQEDAYSSSCPVIA